MKRPPETLFKAMEMTGTAEILTLIDILLTSFDLLGRIRASGGKERESELHLVMNIEQMMADVEFCGRVLEKTAQLRPYERWSESMIQKRSLSNFDKTMCSDVGRVVKQSFLLNLGPELPRRRINGGIPDTAITNLPERIATTVDRVLQNHPRLLGAVDQFAERHQSGIDIQVDINSVKKQAKAFHDDLVDVDDFARSVHDDILSLAVYFMEELIKQQIEEAR
jgi:hypothetical protein